MTQTRRRVVGFGREGKARFGHPFVALRHSRRGHRFSHDRQETRHKNQRSGVQHNSKNKADDQRFKQDELFQLDLPNPSPDKLDAGPRVPRSQQLDNSG